MRYCTQVLIPEERVTPYQALQSITISAAKQHREEATKGTLTVRKLADLVILSANPLKVCGAFIPASPADCGDFVLWLEGAPQREH